MSGFNTVWGALGAAFICAVVYFVVPRGQNQVLTRTALIMTLICCYLMWAITYLAQLHPLISPRRSDLRPHHQVEHSAAF